MFNIIHIINIMLSNVAYIPLAQLHNRVWLVGFMLDM